MVADGRNGKAVACNGPTAAHRQKNDKKAIISPKSPPVSIIIRPYKSAVTKHVNRSGFENGWQPRFQDHMIRNKKFYQDIAQYIQTSPEHGPGDRNGINTGSTVSVSIITFLRRLL